MEWFEEWFDSKYYHMLYANRDDKEAQLFMERLFNFLKIPANSNVMDLACGKGRHSIYMASKGYHVTGTDLSSNSIKLAQQFEQDNLRFFVHDMRERYSDEQFDAVLNLFTSFGYFNNENENSRVLQSIESMLKPNGTFVIDYMNAAKVIVDLVEDEQKIVNNIQFNLSRKVEDGQIIKSIDFTADNQSYSYQEKVQSLGKQDFIRLLAPTNLTILSFFGDYLLNPYDEKTSDRLIIIGKKK